MYNFDLEKNRRNTNSLKWNVRENELPMWVADMDFETAPEIKQALLDRVSFGIFGYEDMPDSWYEAYINWWKKQHRFTIDKNWLIFTTGVIPILSTTVRKLTTPGENVLVQTPVYNMFFNSIVNNGRNIIESPLCYKDGKYEIDFGDLEAKLANPQTTLMILCNPHNPIGMIWDKETLARIGDLCSKHYVTVISDEIHCDLTAPGKSYVPFASASKTCEDISVTCITPTKAFNIAGIHTAAAMIPNPNLRHKVWRALNTDEVAEPNSFAITAAVAAFEKGGQWLLELREYIQENKNTVVDFLSEELNSVSVVSTDVTYLLWLDVSKVTKDSKSLAYFLRKETGLFVSEGSSYGKAGEGFLRLNVACTKKTLKDGLMRLKKGVELYQNQNKNN